jgi:hypothetical protein
VTRESSQSGEGGLPLENASHAVSPVFRLTEGPPMMNEEPGGGVGDEGTKSTQQRYVGGDV